MNKALLIAAVAIVTTASLATLVSGQTPASKLTPTELLAKQGELTDKPVTVEGTLSNSGSNYFTDLRVILKDSKESAEGVLVQPWLPVETPPKPESTGRSAPALSDYFGKKVVINGVLTDGVVKKVGATKLLRVDSVRIVD
jgi:hypothetical protein